MKKIKSKRSPLLLITGLLIVILAIPVVSYAAQTTVNLGTTSTFAVLAGTTITNIGSTEINGSAGSDIGTFPGVASTTSADATISESVSLSSPDAKAAQEDLVAAYNDAAGRSPVTRISTKLGGKTLKPGVYDSASGTFELTGTLTLDAQGDPDGVFIFLMDSTLVTASNSIVDTIGSARYGRIYWKVGSSATLGADSEFAGHILALTSIDAKKDATIRGQLLAINGEVRLDNNQITNGLSTTIRTSTVSGGELPETAIPWYSILMVGVGLASAGFVFWVYRRRYAYNIKNLV